jgi:hypothetical protein
MNFLLAENKKNRLQKAGFIFLAKIRKMTDDNCLHKSFSIFYQLQA